MAKGKRQHKVHIPKSGTITVLTSLEATRAQRPKYNGFAVGHGLHGDSKYNRAREKRRLGKLDRAYL